MSLNDELDIELSPQAKTQSAYDHASRAEFSASTLYPWTIQRHSLAMSLGCQVMSAIGPCVTDFLNRGTYANLYRDVIIVLWLSSLDVARLNKLDRDPDPSKVMPEAYEWAEQNEILYASENFVEGVEIIDGIIQGILSSAFSPEKSSQDGEDTKKKATKQPGKLKRAISPLKRPAKLRAMS